MGTRGHMLFLWAIDLKVNTLTLSLFPKKSEINNTTGLGGLLSENGLFCDRQEACFLTASALTRDFLSILYLVFNPLAKQSESLTRARCFTFFAILRNSCNNWQIGKGRTNFSFNIFPIFKHINQKLFIFIAPYFRDSQSFVSIELSLGS